MSSSQCATPWKVAYLTRAAAMRSLRGMKMRYRRDPGVAGKVEAYKCRSCGEWHVGHRRDKAR